MEVGWNRIAAVGIARLEAGVTQRWDQDESTWPRVLAQWVDAYKKDAVPWGRAMGPFLATQHTFYGEQTVCQALENLTTYLQIYV